MYKIFFFTLVLLVIISCDKTYNSNVDIPYEGDKLVLNGIISPDSIRFQLTKSLPITGNFTLADYFVKNSQIWIEDENKQKVGISLISNGFDFFQKTKLLQVEKKYKIFASADGFQTIETEWITIPKSVQLTNNQQELNQFACDCNKLLLSFQDTEKEKNYYNINFVAFSKGKKYEVEAFLSDAEIKNNRCYTHRGIFDDNCFDGKNVKLEYGFNRTIAGIPNVSSFDTLQCRFGTVSREAYDYKQSKDVGTEFISGINDPLPSYKNVINGYGFVFAQNWQNYFIKVK